MALFLVWALLVHWLWETLHAGAYVETAGPLLRRAWHCLPMAGIDAVWSLGLYVAAGAILLAARGRAAGWPFAIAIALLGAATAAAVEVDAVATGRWTYNDLMPLVPGLRIGVSPLLQMAVVPVAAARLSGVLPGTSA